MIIQLSRYILFPLRRSQIFVIIHFESGDQETSKRAGHSAFAIDVYRVIKGQKIPSYINNVSYDSNEGKFKGFLLYPNGGYFTWIGKFTKNNSFSGDIVFNFNQEGVQTIEMKFIKVN